MMGEVVTAMDVEHRNRIVRRVLLGIMAALVLASFAIGIRW